MAEPTRRARLTSKNIAEQASTAPGGSLVHWAGAAPGVCPRKRRNGRDGRDHKWRTEYHSSSGSKLVPQHHVPALPKDGALSRNSLIKVSQRQSTPIMGGLGLAF